jgi:LmbE family N-acetylglucosaminyl deacetylase
LYYVDPIEGIDYFGKAIVPGFTVDISATFDLKIRMLACHASQRDWLFKQHGLDEYLESCKKWSAKRGAEIGATYGESFTQHTGHPYPHDNRLVELLQK